MKRRSAGAWAGGTCSAGAGLVRGGGRSRRCGRGRVGGSLDGQFVVSPQDAHAGGFLLGLLCLLLLLLLQHLLVQDQLNILLSEVKRIYNQVHGRGRFSTIWWPLNIYPNVLWVAGNRRRFLLGNDYQVMIHRRVHVSVDQLSTYRQQR